MKTLKYTILSMLAMFAVSCNTDDVENRPVVAGTDAPVLEAPEEGNAYVLNPETLDLLAERFVWSTANFGEGIISNYDLEIDVAGDEFDTPSVIGTTNGVTQLAVSTNVLNSAIQQLDVTPFEASTFQVRVKAYVGDSVLYSNAVEITVTSFSTDIPLLWIPGGYQSASGYGNDWTHATAPQLSAESFGKKDFEGYMYIANDITNPDNGFKFSAQDSWTGTNYGMGANAGELSTDGGNLIANAGYYWVKVSTGSTPPTYSMTATQWAVTGSGTPNGWPDNGIMDHDMTYDPAAKVWKITLTLSAGEIKFRANDEWAINYGDAGTDGVLDFNDGTNIPVTAGTYEIKLDFSNPRHYTYTLTPQ